MLITIVRCTSTIHVWCLISPNPSTRPDMIIPLVLIEDDPVSIHWFALDETCLGYCCTSYISSLLMLSSCCNITWYGRCIKHPRTHYKKLVEMECQPIPLLHTFQMVLLALSTKYSLPPFYRISCSIPPERCHCRHCWTRKAVKDKHMSKHNEKRHVGSYTLTTHYSPSYTLFLTHRLLMTASMSNHDCGVGSEWARSSKKKTSTPYTHTRKIVSAHHTHIQ